MTERQGFSQISEELNCIAENSTVKSRRTIVDYEAFEKTQTYKRLRKNSLSDEELKFMFDNYYLNGSEIETLTIGKIKDLNITKAIKIGIIKTMTDINTNGLWLPRNTYETSLTNHLKVIEYEEELNEIIDFAIEYQQDSENSRIGGLNTLSTLLDWFWGRDGKFNQSAIGSINKHYHKLLSFFMSIDSNVIRNRSFDGSLFYSFEEPNKHKEETTFPQLANALKRMPFMNTEKVITFLDKFNSINVEDKVYALIYGLVVKEIPVFVDIDKSFIDIEAFHIDNRVATPLDLIMARVLSDIGNDSKIGHIVNKLSRESEISTTRRREIFKTFFSNKRFLEDGDSMKMKLKLLASLRVKDEEIAQIINKYTNKRTHYGLANLGEVYKYNPEDKDSYPGFKTLVAIARNQLVISGKIYPNDKYSNEELLEMYYFGELNDYYFNSIFPMTYRMACDPNFLRKIVSKYYSNNHIKIHSATSSFNIKAIGFKKYITILEDVQRSKAKKVTRRRPASIFSLVHSSSFNYATNNEIFCLKNKYDLIRSNVYKFLDYKTLNYIINSVKLKANPESSHFNAYELNMIKNTMIHNLSCNKRIEKDEMLELMISIEQLNTGGYYNSIFAINYPNNKLQPVRIYISGTEDKNITVKDINDYYDKKERV